MRVESASRQGRPLTGAAARSLVDGGQFTNKFCKCSGVTVFSYSDACNIKVAVKGQSCVHNCGKILYCMAAGGWSADDAREAVFDPDNKGMVWLQVQDDAEEVFWSWWADSLALAAANAERLSRYEWVYGPYARPGQPGASEARTAKRFRYWWGGWKRLLDYIEAHPGQGRNEIVAGMTWREGITKKYLAEAIRRGYVIFTEGPNRKRAHTVVAWPAKPVRKAGKHFTKAQVKAVSHGRTFTLEEYEAEFGADLAWQEEMRQRKSRTPQDTAFSVDLRQSGLKSSGQSGSGTPDDLIGSGGAIRDQSPLTKFLRGDDLSLRA